MFHTVLVANRGEIARRIMRTLRSMQVRSVAVYSEGDAGAAHVRDADEAICIGTDPATESYLRVDALIAAARASGAEAIHPGYGFLSESAELARACEAAGIVFIGPGVHALEVMGDKVRARQHLADSGVPEVPGFADTDPSGAPRTTAELLADAETVGFPLLVKPSAGGGGKGMQVVREQAELMPALTTAKRLAQASFGDDSMLIERLIERPRHIEVQVFGTAEGEMIALGERECTLQRRHQKVVEEAPNAGGISAATIDRMTVAAVNAAASVNYVGAGTVEFLVDADKPDDFFFIEMNTRLQVEHPVTEAVTGVDLVELQVRDAAGEPVLNILQTSSAELETLTDPETHAHVGWRVAATGHAVEARVYAESPERDFLPSIGTILAWRETGLARVDSAVEEGDEVSSAYDPMIAKVIAHAATRADALDALDLALHDTVILGVDTNVRFVRALLAHDRVRSADLDTGLIETMLPFPPLEPPPHVVAAAAEAATRRSLEARPAHGANDLWLKPVIRHGARDQ